MSPSTRSRPRRITRRRTFIGHEPMLLRTAAIAAALALGASTTASAHPSAPPPTTYELASFAAPGCTGGCGSGSTVGPDGALYVTDGKGGRVLRINPVTGAMTTFASGLPPAVAAVGIGGAIDVAFIGRTAYVLVTLVGPSLGQPDVVDGIYRITKDGTATPVADLGAWSTLHPPATDFFVPSGAQYALDAFRGGFVVTDGHLNRVLRVTRDGRISQLLAFANVVPTGLEVAGRTIYMAEAGPVPHLPQDGKIVAFTPQSPAPTEVAVGARLAVDVELGPWHQLYALSQGVFDLPPLPENAGKPASPNTGTLMRLDSHGTLRPIVAGLDRPTSLEFLGTTAFVTTLTGQVLRIDNASWGHAGDERR